MPAPYNPDYDVSYLSLRKSIGVIGILMPILVRLWAGLHEGAPKLLSISAYYYTAGRDLFVGSLFAAGLFLSFYRGGLNSLQDRILAVLWGASAAFIGLTPMDMCGDKELVQYLNLKDCVELPTLHIVPVSIFFAISIYMTLFRFPKSAEPRVTDEKNQRNKIYIACGIVMLISVAAIAYRNSVGGSIFAPEATAIAAFGLSWLVKGQLIKPDKP